MAGTMDMALNTLNFPRFSRLGRALLVLVAMGIGLSACASNRQRVVAIYVERPIGQIYADAWAQIQRGNWLIAGAQFDEVERQHPYSIWARRAMLMSAYCYYQANQYEEAIRASNAFIQLHPGNRNVPYAYYLKAVSLYEQIPDVYHDQAKTTEAMVALQDLIQRYPDSEFARDARLKIDLTRDHLAGKEMAVGRYYLRAGETLAAIVRFQNVVDTYQTTSHTPEALERLTEAYLTLGLVSEAQTAAAVLGYNYPGNPWYQDAYSLLTDADIEPVVDEASWISRAFSSLF